MKNQFLADLGKPGLGPMIGLVQLYTAVVIGGTCLFTLHFLQPQQVNKILKSDSRKCKVNKQAPPLTTAV